MLGLSTEKNDSPKGLLSNLLGLKAGAKDDKFSLLLQSFALGKIGEKTLLSEAQTDEMPAAGKSDTKSGSLKLLKLFSLGNEEGEDEEQFHPDILKALPLKEVKQTLKMLIGEAKSYLKQQITLKTDIKELPKTLGGLIKLAEQSGIDVKAIDFESLGNSSTKQELSQVLNLTKLPVQTILPHSTNQLVKPGASAPAKEKEPVKPLNALLNDTSEGLLTVEKSSLEDTAKTDKKPLFNASINTLLHGEENDEKELVSKVEGDKAIEKPSVVTQSKTEQLSQKIIEAKQLVQHVAQSMKEAVENYKPPFTCIKMQLNPQKFGEMDVTLVQRGNNVHININANTTALTVMMQNSHELKAQLSAQGLGDTSMNFSSHQQQGEQKREEQAHLAYEEFQDYEEEFTEIATALEIVVPRYI